MVNSEEYKEDPKAMHTKVMQYAASLGVSRQDLPAELRSRLDSWLATGNPNPDASNQNPSKRKSAPVGQEPKEKKKKAEDKKQKRKRS